MPDQVARDTAAADRQVIETWIRDSPRANARLTAADDPYEPGRVIFVVDVPERAEMVRARRELRQLMAAPERLRVRRSRPSQADIDRVQDWVWKNCRPHGGPDASVAATWPDPVSGLLAITLNKADREYAEELEAATDGLAFVRPEPDEGISLTHSAANPPDAP